MATNPKMAPCPNCKTADYLGVYSYESGTRRVECDHHGCWYIGPREGSIRQAIKSHNAKCAANENVCGVVECDQCGGSGFDTPGTGYGNVCGKCGGQKALPR